MSGDTVECFNCGHANPSWAQVCRNCGAPMTTEVPRRAGPLGMIPTDRGSLTSIGATVGAILAAIVIGTLLSGLIPPAPNVAETTPTPSPSPSSSPSGSTPVSSGSGAPSVSPSPGLIGTISYGYALDPSTHTVTEPTESFAPGDQFCYSISLTEPFGTAQIGEEVLRIESDGSLTVVQSRDKEIMDVTPAAQVAGFCTRATGLIQVWSTGNFIMREYRGVELIAEGRFAMTG
ncbi:MAG: zinc ribbon domain-containing protein [Chloroflexi bacterium]|nr:MAG: zinc ribbon domain-containing protein [Chloroflexota bacterium]